MTVSEGSNRAVDSKLIGVGNESATAAKEVVDQFFDANGNQTKMKGIPEVEWNYGDNIANVTLILREDGKDNDGEYYVYDSSGSRVRKVTERNGNVGKMEHIDEVIYLGGLEIRRTLSNKIVTEERHCLRVMDDESQVAVRNYWTVCKQPKVEKKTQVRYQLENHLGSAAMEVDKEGKLISYEEYFPYGGTAFVVGKNQAEVKLRKV